jgi:DNA-directed RNA polymerase specialized sigma24 family protein
VIIDENQYESALLHYGILRRSGRYPWGSGGNVVTRSKAFINWMDDLKAQGFSDKEICESFSSPNHTMKLTDLRAMRSIASNQVRTYNINLATRLRDKGWSVPAIARRMDVPPSNVRSWLAPAAARKKHSLEETMDMLKQHVGENNLVDVGLGVEHQLGITNTQLKTAVAGLKMQGYQVHNIKEDQVANPGQRTSILTLCPPGTTWAEASRRRSEIAPPNMHSEDFGETWLPLLAPPKSLSSSRIAVRWKEDGGEAADGVIYVRPGVKDLDMGGNHYAQVRILVDGTHYLKGMAVYKSDLPKGVDVLFNTNKERSSDKHKAMKEIETLTENPFGTLIKRQIRKKNPDGTEGEVTSVLNIVSEAGDWSKWSKTLSAQMLSKQSNDLVRRQLDQAYEVKKAEYDEIMALSNPTVRRKLLDDFASGADAAAVHLKAHALPRQRWQVLLPVEDISPTQVYAPNFDHGERVVLIRYPHGGKFEIPELTVNNRHRNAIATLGSDLRDAVGVHPDVAKHLSGADFDGDTVLVIPNRSGQIKAKPAFDELRNFNPRDAFMLAPGRPKPDKSYMGKQMGFVSNLIADMTVMGASDDEIVRAVKHSMVVIDAAKHGYDHKLSRQVHGIDELMKKYQGVASGSASTVISRSGTNAKTVIPERRPARKEEGGPIDPKTGALVYVPTGKTYVDKKTGKTVVKKQRVPRLSLVSDVHTLSSGTVVEGIYADHANRMKALANQARLSMIRTPRLERSPTAAKVYRDEVDSLRRKLVLAQQVRPLERKAQLLANTMVKAKRQEYPDLDEKQIKKIESVALTTARLRLKSAKPLIEFTPKEWEAIQAGAVSDNLLEKLLANADVEKTRALATPRAAITMTPAKKKQAESMLSLGYTMSEVAERLGTSVSTVERSVYGTEDTED